MPIRRFRDARDMKAELVPESPDRLLRKIEAVWRLASAVCDRRFPAGVYKNRSIDEANQRRAAWSRPKR